MVFDVEQYDFETVYDAYLCLGMELEWTMRDLTEIKLKDMEDSHIANCIRMLNHNIKERVTQDSIDRMGYWIRIFEDVQLKRRNQKILKLKKNING